MGRVGAVPAVQRRDFELPRPTVTCGEWVTRITSTSRKHGVEQIGLRPFRWRGHWPQKRPLPRRDSALRKPLRVFGTARKMAERLLGIRREFRGGARDNSAAANCFLAAHAGLNPTSATSGVRRLVSTLLGAPPNVLERRDEPVLDWNVPGGRSPRAPPAPARRPGPMTCCEVS